MIESAFFFLCLVEQQAQKGNVNQCTLQITESPLCVSLYVCLCSSYKSYFHYQQAGRLRRNIPIQASFPNLLASSALFLDQIEFPFQAHWPKAIIGIKISRVNTITCVKPQGTQMQGRYQDAHTASCRCAGAYGQFEAE